ncbi:MAG: hypothetical protein H7831_14175 [Magnetococcus sp. WYHC-3]
MGVIDDLKAGKVALDEAIGKLEDARCLVRRFMQQAEPQSKYGEAIMVDAEWMEKELDHCIEDAEDISKEYSSILDAVDVAEVIRRQAHG